MPKTVRIPDLDDEVYAALALQAAEAGPTVPELLRREAARLAGRPLLAEWLERTRRGPSAVTRRSVIDSLDELRGNWPEVPGEAPSPG